MASLTTVAMDMALEQNEMEAEDIEVDRFN